MPSTELNPAFLQAAVTFGLAVLWSVLYARYRKPAFRWWAVAFGLYLVRLAAIITFLRTGDRFWLYAHQVVTGWTALALLWSALVFSRGVRLRPYYLLVTLFPPAWSYLAIYRFQNFASAAWPAVLFLSGATFWTAIVFGRLRRQTGSRAAVLLCVAFALWALHHLDYPILRARGSWNPWGYYVDLAFELSVGTGIVFLVLEDVERGLRAMAAISAELQQSRLSDDLVGALLTRALALPSVKGSAMYDQRERRFVRGVGACATWENAGPGPDMEARIRAAIQSGRPQSIADWLAPDRRHFPFGAVLSVERDRPAQQAIVIVGDARDPFTALDEGFLRALGQQVGAALANTERRRLAMREEGDRQTRLQQLTRLTPREREVLGGIAHGGSSKEIAASLGLSSRTVESYRASLMQKLDIRNVAGLTRFALDAGLLQDSAEPDAEGALRSS